MNQSEKSIDEMKKGLLQWIDIPPDSNILFYGKECSALAELTKSRSQKVIFADPDNTNFAEWEKRLGAFDVIIAIETLEKTEEPQRLLKIWKQLLKKDGILILGMNNRLGLRFLCGDRDIYTDRSFDGVEGYRRAYAKKEDGFRGRMYHKAEMRHMLQEAEWKYYQFYSVLPDLASPQLIYEEHVLPNEDLSHRFYPAYHFPDSVFLEEEHLYQSLIDNDLFHQLANSYLILCTLQRTEPKICHVTSSMGRNRENALLTVIRTDRTVEKHAAFPEGIQRLKNLEKNSRELDENGIAVLNGSLSDNVYKMPFIREETGMVYLEKLLLTDPESFFQELDHFCNLIKESSPVQVEDSGDGMGMILSTGYPDMVPWNSFHINGEFLFFDQEYAKKSYPVNAIIARTVMTFAGKPELQKLISVTDFLNRYGLLPEIDLWQKKIHEFLDEVLNTANLREYAERHRRNAEIVHTNRQRINYTEQEYQKLFVDLFSHLEGKQLVLFGSGAFAKKFLALYGNRFPVAAILDNQANRWGETIGQAPIYSPEYLKSLKKGTFKVFICIKDYTSVVEQLKRLEVSDYSIYDPSRSYNIVEKEIKFSSLKKEKEPRKKYHIGYVAGVFDLFHIGHLNLLRRAKEQCDYLIVGVVTDEGVRKYKEKEPFIPFQERIEMVRACRYVDEAVEIPINYGGTRDAYRLYQFDCQFSGSDYMQNPNWQSEKRFLEKNGVDMVFFPYTEQTNSTKIKELIQNKFI
ncbi:MAG: adenylyltransferase/cytidyltransferase family protein [Lachnospiraceae bacterium]